MMKKSRENTTKRGPTKATLTRVRIKAEKKEFLVLYEQSMSVVVASLKLGIHRATFYKWHAADELFAKKFAVLRKNKVQYVRDQLEALISTGDRKAIMFFLQHNAPEYANNLKLIPGGEWAEEAEEKKKLSTDQRILIRAALSNIFIEPNADTIKKIGNAAQSG